MLVEITMPALSPTMEKGTIAKWLINIGDVIKTGDLIAEIETDKATMEVEATEEGMVIELLYPEGSEDIVVGSAIARIGPQDAQAPELSPEPPSTQAITHSEDHAPHKPSFEPADGADARATHITKTQPGPSSTPLARRIADARGIDLGSIKGSGPGGRIVKADLGLPTKISSASRPSEPTMTANFDFGPQREIPHEETKLSSMRKTIARRLTESKQQIPHIYLTIDVRMDDLLDLRARINDALAAEGMKVSVNDMLVKALALALREVPSCNVSFAGDTLLQYHRSDISVAVSIANGLITPVIKSADSKSLSAIAAEAKALAARAREGRLHPSEYQGGTASISNMGMMGIRQFAAVINPPQAMILAVGAAERRAIVIDDKIEIATMLSLTGSFDHRAIDGADGALLMGSLRRLVEQPLGILA